MKASSSRPRIAAALAGLFVAFIWAPSAMSQDASTPRGLQVDIDRTQRIQLRAPASSVIVANPAVADVTVVDAGTLYVTGRGYGSTEVVVVDAIGRTLYQAVVTVGAPNNGQVRVWRGSEAVEMTCGAGCAPSARQAPGSGGTP